MSFKSIEEMVRIAIEEKRMLWEVVRADDMRERGLTEKESMRQMLQMYEAMKESVRQHNPTQKSRSGLVGGDAKKLKEAMQEGRLLCGDLMNQVMIRAISVSEANACMKRIVAAPTAGSCGVLPGILITLQEEKQLTDEKMVEALYIAAGIGEVIAQRATLSGAEGGCQAEIGAASSMAAGAVAYLNGGNLQAIIHAAAIALKNLLGLVCDPVAGLVEVPCVKRNVVGSVNAIAAADMAIAGIKSAIPVDEVIDAMADIGRQMPSTLKETAKGGLATTPTGLKIAESL